MSNSAQSVTNQSDARLAKMQAIASIAASIAVPLILAVFGFLVQRQLSSEGIKKDYVQIATSILKESSTNQDPELRKWAVDILDSNAAIPFSPAAKHALQGGLPIVRSEFLFLPPPKECMSPPAKIELEGLINSAIKPKYIYIENQKAFLIKIAEETDKASSNAASLICLQKYVNIIKENSEKFNASQYGFSGASSPSAAKVASMPASH